MPLSGPKLAAPIRVSDLLRRSLESKPDEPALVSADARLSWRELDQASDNLAANLLAQGLRKGDRVASLMPNRIALLVHYLACMKAELVATPLNYRYMPPEIDHALEVSEASLIVAHAERDADLAASKLAPSLPLGTIRYGAKDDRTPRLEELIDRKAGQADLAIPDPASPALIFFTSGSTGKPKGVTHTFETFSWMMASAVAAFDLGPNDVVLPGSSISHVGGFLNSFMALAAGARVVVPRTWDGDELLPLLRHERPTVLIMLPAALFALVRDHSAVHDDFGSLRLCLSGGDKVSAELEREYTELTGLTIDEGYGMSEIGYAASNPPSRIKLGSLGRPHPGFEASIRGDDGREVSTGELGNVWIRSRSNMVGYWMRPDATQETIRDGWLDTGDVMKCDADGYLWFAGRKKQIIVNDGSNICPQEIEEALLEHPSIELAGVVGVHDLVHGENVRAYVSLKKGAARPIAQELIRFARQRVGYKAPEEIVLLDEMPLNPTGKVDRVALKQMAVQAARP